MAWCLNSQGQNPDTLVSSHSPTKAALLSAVLPGAGQIYNRKFWKLPFVYGGLVALGYTTQQYNDLFTKYSHAIIAQSDNDPFTVETDPLLQGSLDGLKRIRDQYRRNRDYFAILTLMYYGLTVLDAAVDAHFKDFDVSPKLSMKFKPLIEPLPQSLPIVGFGVSFRLKGN